MNKVTFITGNQGKADFLAKFLGHPIDHQKVELDEVQSLDLREVAEYKARHAYGVIRSPILVEDTALDFTALGRLPGTFIKWFLDEVGNNRLCRVLDSFEDRSATARVCFAYFDGKNVKFFEGEVKGRIAENPGGEGGFGWDFIFIPEGSNKTYSEMEDEETEKFSLRTTTVYPQLKEFLSSLDKN